MKTQYEITRAAMVGARALGQTNATGAEPPGDCLDSPSAWDDFLEVWIAALARRGVVRVDPMSEEANQGLGRVHRWLSSLAQASGDAAEQRWLTRLRDRAAPSSPGIHDAFITDLRALRGGFVRVRASRHAPIDLVIAQHDAVHRIDKALAPLSALASTAADRYLGIDPPWRPWWLSPPSGQRAPRRFP